ncbi:DUF397 domain-containing protein [Amycolatopsis mongoliensis]|uniref:DUF397 domain-containing protein n=1 Tax=Amycolatopsis mongoliensis TaxID=715475 RepID=A0A9Y2JP07_9PSEU|nr:DUF397 domain-containing protein [Amycolatopsis sp. 4-36]WIY02023.1 DUF397 domain-containing protein [Amycolatopsis sp. 4-36]
MTWRKSSYSGEQGECVEVRLGGLSQIRDSKDRAGGTLSVTTRSWDAFVARVGARKPPGRPHDGPVASAQRF